MAKLLARPAQELETGERRVALVEVMVVDMDAECLEGAHAAYAEHDLLSDAIVAVARVKSSRDPAIFLVYRFEKVERNVVVSIDPKDGERYGFAVDRDFDGNVLAHEARTIDCRGVIFRYAALVDALPRKPFTP